MLNKHLKTKIIYRKKNKNIYSTLVFFLKMMIKNEKFFNFIRPFKVFITNSFILYSTVIYYKILTPKYLNLPSRHLFSFIILNRFLKIYEKDKLRIFLLGGTLLGCVRQNAFSGRPYDIDLGILEEDYDKLKNKFPLLSKIGVSMIRTKNTRKTEKYLSDKSKSSVDRVAFIFFNVKIDIAVYKKVEIYKKIKWLGEIEKKYVNKFNGLLFKNNDLGRFKFGNLYDKRFYIPNNSINYLEERFGKNWKIPDSKYYFEWKK